MDYLIISYLYKMSLASTYVSSTSPTNSFSDDVFVYVILTNNTVAVNSIIPSADTANLVNLVVLPTVTNAGTKYYVTQLNSNAFYTDTPTISTISIPNTINAMFNQTMVSSPSLFNPAGPTPYNDNYSILTSITVTGGSSNFIHTDSYGILYVSSLNNGVFDTLFAAPPAFNSTGYTIPSNVTTIGPYAFVNSKITSIVIPTNVTAIGTYAFFLVYLESLTIEGVISNFGYMPFYSQNSTPEQPAGTLTNLICKAYSRSASDGVNTANQFIYMMYTSFTIKVTNTDYGNAIKNSFEEEYASYSGMKFQYIPESTSDGVGSIASSVQTELQTALAGFSFLNPYAIVNYDARSGNVSVVADERELKGLGNILNKLSMPHKISGLSVSYSKTGRMYSQKLDYMVEKINSGNIGRTKRGQSAIYFDNVPGDTDTYTGNLAALAGDDSGSFGCQKMYATTIVDSGSSVFGKLAKE
jgi:hypothetical protein